MKITNNKILIPVDFGEQSIIAVKQTYNLARLTNSQIVLLHVIKEQTPLWGLLNVSEREELKYKIEQKMRFLIAEIKKAVDVDVISIIEKGNIIDKILDAVNRINPSFIFMGTTGSNDIRKKIIGSKALRLIKEASCPVITIKGKSHNDGCENIILPIDTTKKTLQKINNAVQFASFFNSKITIVTVVSAKDNKETKKTKKVLEDTQKQIQSYKIDCDMEIITLDGDKQDIATGIIGTSHKLNGDIILIMTQQESDFVSFFIGSLAKEIIHGSDIPVMSINPS